MSTRKRKDRNALVYDFFSFPTVYGFLLGALIASLISPVFPVLAFYLALIPFSWANAHLLTAFWRKRRGDKARARAEEDERERRALLARQNASLANEEASTSASRRRRRRRGRPHPSP